MNLYPFALMSIYPLLRLPCIRCRLGLVLLLLQPLPMRLAKRPSDDQREHQRRVGVSVERGRRIISRGSQTNDPAIRAGRAYTLTLSPSILILPQLTASSGRAPESDPSNSWPVLM
jgi:hypothetical protein